MLFYHAGKNLPEKLAFKTLLNTLYNLSKHQFSASTTVSQGVPSKPENGSQEGKKMKKSKAVGFTDNFWLPEIVCPVSLVLLFFCFASFFTQNQKNKPPFHFYMYNVY